MSEKGKERFYQELEKFVATRLRPFPYFYDSLYYYDHVAWYLNAEHRLKQMDRVWENEYRYRKNRGELVYFTHMTNHEICHEMFWNAFMGRSRMYIQIPDLNSEENLFSNYSDRGEEGKGTEGKNEEDVITLSCTLLTLQMLDYDIMMFRAMNDQEDKEYSDAAIKHYRPYLFSYVAEIDRKKYIELQRLQKLQKQEYRTTSEIAPSDAGDGPYLWLACTFNPDAGKSLVNLEGYVVQSASRIEKIKAALSIIEDDGTSNKVKKDILDGYKLETPCIPDNEFMKELKGKIDSLSSVYVYRIGNGNCIYAENEKKDKNFFYDIGFNCKHRPKKLSSKSNYNYSSAMKKIFANKPSFFILSHWDLDHIAGSFAAKKAFLDKKWFAPDCYDACTDAQRLAKYLDLKGNLLRVARTKTGRLLGKINTGNNTTYKLFMGEKASCDSSRSNCEGIVIEYEDANNTVMMMGDVNYASYNKAINNYNKTLREDGSLSKQEPLFADTQIDYLIVPHHGSEHTDYELITDNNSIKKGIEAIICCTNEPADNRPNDSHKMKLEKRFAVSITEIDAKEKDYIEIRL